MPSRSVPVLSVAFVFAIACQRGPAPSSNPRLPEGRAGEIVQRAIEASGGWERWRTLSDVSFVSTFLLYDPLGNLAQQTVGMHKSPLHVAPRARFESIGIPEREVIGFDGHETWLLRAGRAVPGRDRLLLARFNMVSDIFWFSLPFNLGEIPAKITDLGDEEDDEGKWQRLKVELGEGAPEAPGDWFVLWIDSRTGLIGRVFLHVTAEFLRHRFWMGKWVDYQDWEGLRKERRRQFFPADPEGKVIGPLAAERLVEEVRLNNGFAAGLFEKPLAADGGEPA